MGASESGDLRIQNAPLMSDVQRKFLDNYILAMQQMMKGKVLGAPWGGASTESYDPRKMMFMNTNTPSYDLGPWRPPGTGGPRDPDKRRRKERPGNKPTPPGDGDTGGGDERTPRTPRDRRGGGLTGSMFAPWMNQQTEGRSPVSPYPSILNNMPTASPQSGMGYDQQLQQLLTSPFALPYMYGQTGNFPKK